MNVHQQKANSMYLVIMELLFQHSLLVLYASCKQNERFYVEMASIEWVEERIEEKNRYKMNTRYPQDSTSILHRYLAYVSTFLPLFWPPFVLFCAPSCFFILPRISRTRHRTETLPSAKRCEIIRSVRFQCPINFRKCCSNPRVAEVWFQAQGAPF